MFRAAWLGWTPPMSRAARDLGASPTRAFYDVTLPLITPAILSGALLSFAMSMDDVVISFFVTGTTSNTLPLQVYSMLKMGVTPEVNALCTLMLLVVFWRHWALLPADHTPEKGEKAIIPHRIAGVL